MKKKTIKHLAVVIVFVVITGLLTEGLFPRKPAPTIRSPLREFYLATNFQKIIEALEQQPFASLPDDEKLLYIECLARTSRGGKASQLIQPLLESRPDDPTTLAVAGTVQLSLGRLEKAKSFLMKALQKNPKHIKTLIASTLLALNYRDRVGTRKYYQTLTVACKEIDAAWGESEGLFTLGVEVFRSSGEPALLAQLYQQQAKLKKKNKLYKSLYRSLNDTARMHKRAAKKKPTLFEVTSVSDMVALPFTGGEKDLRSNMVTLVFKGKEYKVILDTGNTTGWMVHDRSLNEALKPVTGGRTLARIGTEAGVLDGYRQFYKAVEFDGFNLNNIYGIYVPKPHPDFPDANLNPSFIKNRVVSIDFVEKRLILRTPRRFEADLKARNDPSRVIQELPWYGYKYIYVPASISGKQGLAVIETGAEDIALKTDFIKGLQLPLKPKKKYLSNGQVVNYQVATVEVLLGKLRFHRRAADVWPLDRFFDRLSGLSPDIVMGPTVFRKAFVVSFNPFDQEVILEYFSKPPGPL